MPRPKVFYTDPERDDYEVSEIPLVVIFHWERGHFDVRSDKEVSHPVIDKISNANTDEVIFDMANFTTQQDYENKTADIDMHNLVQLIQDEDTQSRMQDREDELAYGLPEDTESLPEPWWKEQKLKNQEIKMSTRLERLKNIVKAAPRVLVEDEANPTAVEEGFAPDINIPEEEASDLPLEAVPANDARKQLIRERHERMQRLKQKELEKEHNEQREEFRNEEAAPLEVTAPERLVDIRKRELVEEEALLDNPEYDQAVIQRNINSLKKDIAELEAGEESWLGKMDENVEVAENPEAPYDRAKDEAKNQQAREEMEETETEVRRKDRDAFNDIDLEDVILLSDTMYSPEEAKRALNNMPINELRDRVLEKFNALGLADKKKSTKKEKAVEAYLSGNYKIAAEEGEAKEESREEDEDSNASDEEKIQSATYVELYALDKYFSKLIKMKEKSKKKEDEPVDVESLERNFGKKEKLEDFDPGKSIKNKLSPEELARYQNMSPATASRKFSKREAIAMCKGCGEQEDECICEAVIEK